MSKQNVGDNDFQAVFDGLKSILKKHESRLVVAKDQPDYYYLNTPRIMKNRQPLGFGAVKVGKNYVSYHLVPVYACPQMLAKISPELKKRMQGKGCFNFKTVDPELFAELDRLTADGLERFKTIELP